MPVIRIQTIAQIHWNTSTASKIHVSMFLLNNSNHKTSTLYIWTKNLSINSPWDFEGDLNTIKLNWFCPENRFAAKSTGCGAIYCWKNDIPSNMSNQKTNAMYFTNFLRPSTLLLCKCHQNSPVARMFELECMRHKKFVKYMALFFRFDIFERMSFFQQ